MIIIKRDYYENKTECYETAKSIVLLALSDYSALCLTGADLACEIFNDSCYANESRELYKPIEKFILMSKTAAKFWQVPLTLNALCKIKKEVEAMGINTIINLKLI